MDGAAAQVPALELNEPYVSVIAAAGSDTVRLTVRWPAWAALETPYSIDPGFLARVGAVVADVLGQGLIVVLTLHFYDELMEWPHEHSERFLGLWRRLAGHYRTGPWIRWGSSC